MLDELPAGQIVLAGPVHLGGVETVLDQQPRPAVAERIDHGRRSTAVAKSLELRPRPIEISGMKEAGQPIAYLLVRRLAQIGQVRRAQEPVLRDQPDERHVAFGQLERIGSLANEAPLASGRASW